MPNLKAWKIYLNAGNPNSPDIEPEFVKAIKSAESLISSKFPSTSNLIFNSSLNPNIYPEHFSNALSLIKSAEEELLPTPNSTEDMPAGMPRTPSQDETNQPQNPTDSQQIGRMQSVTIPQNIKISPKNIPQQPTNIDDRMVAYTDLINNLK